MGSIARRSAGQLDADASPAAARIRRASAPGNYGAIYELARIIDQFRRELPEDKLTYNVGLVGGGQSADARRRADPAARRPARPTSSPPPPSRAATCARSARTRSSAPGPRCARSSPSRCPARRPRSASTRTAIRRCRRPRAIARCWRGSTRVNRDMGLAADGRARPVRSAAPATSASSPRTSTGWSGLGPASDGSHTANGDGRHPVDLQAGQARRDPDEPAGEGAALTPRRAAGPTIAAPSCNRDGVRGLSVKRRCVRCAPRKELRLGGGSSRSGRVRSPTTRSGCSCSRSSIMRSTCSTRRAS